MQLILTRIAVPMIGAMIVFASSALYNLQPNVIDHRETKHNLIFQLKTKEINKPVIVDINKNTGKVKISWKNKKQGIEFDIEYGNDISPQDREQVDEIMKNIYEHTKKDKSIKGKAKTWIKNYVNKKL
jgi:predicted small metal-binding protein